MSEFSGSFYTDCDDTLSAGSLNILHSLSCICLGEEFDPTSRSLVDELLAFNLNSGTSGNYEDIIDRYALHLGERVVGTPETTYSLAANMAGYIAMRRLSFHEPLHRLRQARSAGKKLIVISGSTTPSVSAFMRYAGVQPDTVLGTDVDMSGHVVGRVTNLPALDKLAVLKELLTEDELTGLEAMGDGLNDIPVLTAANRATLVLPTYKQRLADIPPECETLVIEDDLTRFKQIIEALVYPAV